MLSNGHIRACAFFTRALIFAHAVLRSVAKRRMDFDDSLFLAGNGGSSGGEKNGDSEGETGESVASGGYVAKTCPPEVKLAPTRLRISARNLLCSGSMLRRMVVTRTRRELT